MRRYAVEGVQYSGLVSQVGKCDVGPSRVRSPGGTPRADGDHAGVVGLRRGQVARRVADDHGVRVVEADAEDLSGAFAGELDERGRVRAVRAVGADAQVQVSA